MGHYRYGSTSPYEHYTKLAAIERRQREIDNAQKKKTEKEELERKLAEDPHFWVAELLGVFTAIAAIYVLSLLVSQ